jgi:regulator of protease activity HflC (stomatin/prohibitin superfamily)
MILIFFLLGILLFIALNTRFYSIRPDECAVVTSFGRAQRLRRAEGSPDVAQSELNEEEQKRYNYPQLRTRGPGLYFKWPWNRVHKVRVATEALDLCWDPSKEQENVEAVTKDNLTTDVRGQIRYTVSKSNLYPFFFGVESPLEHVMGFFISIMRERLANFVAPNQGEQKPEVGGGEGLEIFEGISINDIRKNLPLINRYMEEQCGPSASRYGIELDAALITEIDPPVEVDHALSAINTSKNQVAAEISTARADAEQQITMSKRAVEIARNNAEAEVAPLRELAAKLAELKVEGGSKVLRSYIRNYKIPLWRRTKRVIESL